MFRHFDTAVQNNANTDTTIEDQLLAGAAVSDSDNIDGQEAEVDSSDESASNNDVESVHQGELH